jgi:hypothetical protein
MLIFFTPIGMTLKIQVRQVQHVIKQGKMLYFYVFISVCPMRLLVLALIE